MRAANLINNEFGKARAESSRQLLFTDVSGRIHGRKKTKVRVPLNRFTITSFQQEKGSFVAF
jgi:hypothetical protein